jgi:hypothetical protein
VRHRIPHVAQLGQCSSQRDERFSDSMIYSPAHGDTAFTVPLFDQFMLRTMPNWKPNIFS